MGVGPLEVFIFWVSKNGLQKICKILASELRFKLGLMRGFQTGITLGGRTSGSFNFGILVGIQVGHCERFPKRYNT